MAKKAKAKQVKKSKSTRKNETKKKALPALQFCKKCGGILIPSKSRNGVVLACRSCGNKVKGNVRAIKIVEEKKDEGKIIVLEKDITFLPKTDIICPECDHKHAYYWLQQTREADEPPTQFFRCEKCKHVWREYK